MFEAAMSKTNKNQNGVGRLVLVRWCWFLQYVTTELKNFWTITRLHGFSFTSKLKQRCYNFFIVLSSNN